MDAYGTEVERVMNPHFPDEPRWFGMRFAP